MVKEVVLGWTGLEPCPEAQGMGVGKGSQQEGVLAVHLLFQ